MRWGICHFPATVITSHNGKYFGEDHKAPLVDKMGHPGATGASPPSIMKTHSTSHVTRHLISSSPPPLLFFYIYLFKRFVKSIVTSNLNQSNTPPFCFVFFFWNFFLYSALPAFEMWFCSFLFYFIVFFCFRGVTVILFFFFYVR